MEEQEPQTRKRAIHYSFRNTARFGGGGRLARKTAEANKNNKVHKKSFKRFFSRTARKCGSAFFRLFFSSHTARRIRKGKIDFLVDCVCSKNLTFFINARAFAQSMAEVILEGAPTTTKTSTTTGTSNTNPINSTNNTKFEALQELFKLPSSDASPELIVAPRLSRQWTLGSDDPSTINEEDDEEVTKDHHHPITLVSRSRSAMNSSPPLIPRASSRAGVPLLQRQLTLPSDELAADIQAINKPEQQSFLPRPTASIPGINALKRSREPTEEDEKNETLIPKLLEAARRVARKCSDLSSSGEVSSTRRTKRVKMEICSQDMLSQLSDSLERAEMDLDTVMRCEEAEENEEEMEQTQKMTGFSSSSATAAPLTRMESWQMDESEQTSWRIL